MKIARDYTLFISSVAFGILFPQLWPIPKVLATPGDVFGSPNVAVDTFRNRSGTFVLWSDGRITRASGGGADLGHPYSAPPASAQIGTPPLISNQGVGSPNVAVKAVARPDGTFVLFADGNLKRPAHSDAWAGAATAGSKFLTGSWDYADYAGATTRTLPHYRIQVAPTYIIVTPNPPLTGNVKALAFGCDSYYGTQLPMQGSSTGSEIVFRPESHTLQMTSGYFFIVEDNP